MDYVLDMDQRLGDRESLYYRANYVLPFARVGVLRSEQIQCSLISERPGMNSVFQADDMCTLPFYKKRYQMTPLDGHAFVEPE